jgi:glycosyltransferase involved in cell wall biosynthesis
MLPVRNTTGMLVSVVLCTYAPEAYDHFTEAADSVLAQTYDDVELVVVVDGSEEVFERVRADYGDREDVAVHSNDENCGLLASRNRGADVANGDVVAFIDDDAVADEEWIANLVGAYEEHDAIAAGGTMTPEWVAGKPAFLPAEFYWLVGVTHRGFADGEGEVRNTFGSNISFRREVFLDLEGFDPEIGGRKGDANRQGGETELCARLRVAYGRGVYYVPGAEVAHKVFAYRTDPLWLFDRAFWQGYSKRAMETLAPDAGGEETAFLRRLLTEFVPDRCRSLLTDPSLAGVAQLGTLLALTGTVGAGYLYGAIEW